LLLFKNAFLGTCLKDISKPLSKPRLVLDCRHINECIHQFEFKFEDGSVATGGPTG
jgi:hypothetical protein